MFRSEISSYIWRLRRELTIQGLSKKRVDEIATETEAHLVEMVADAQPQNLDAYRRIEEKFGPEGAMARSIAIEYDRAASSRKFLWPAAFMIVAALLMSAPGPLSHWTGTYQFWSHICWTLTVVGFIALGFLARRPSLGQFAIIALGWILIGTTWVAATSYPVAEFNSAASTETPWFVPVNRAKTGEYLALLNKDISYELEVGQLMNLGKEVFAASNTNPQVPGSLSYNGRYLLPEGVREVIHGVQPARLNPSLLTPSWDKAVEAWNGPKMYVMGVGANQQRMDEATVIMTLSPLEAARWERSIDYLNWIRRQPLSVQLPLDFRMVWLLALVAVSTACMVTNLGWLLWLLYRTGKRAYLRRSLRGGVGGATA